ncbi:MAG: SRPBCC family protein [Acidimicrobiia bacterium]
MGDTPSGGTMGTIYCKAHIDVPAAKAWDFLDRYTRSENHIFSNCVSERQDGEYRVVTTVDGMEIWELNVSVDAENMRASYTIPGLLGAEHHHASMQVLDDGTDGCMLVWITDFRPHDWAEEIRPFYDVMFAEMIAAIVAS